MNLDATMPCRATGDSGIPASTGHGAMRPSNHGRKLSETGIARNRTASAIRGREGENELRDDDGLLTGVSQIRSLLRKRPISREYRAARSSDWSCHRHGIAHSGRVRYRTVPL